MGDAGQRRDPPRREIGAPTRSFRRRAALLLCAISAFTAIAVALVWFATEPAGSAKPGPGAGSPPVLEPPRAAAPVATPPLPPGAGIAAPPEWRAQNPTVPVPVPNATAPIDAPPPAGIPTGEAEREDAILTVRRNRFADQMQRLNRRTLERGGKPGDAGARPPSNAPPGPGASRRSALSDPE